MGYDMISFIDGLGDTSLIHAIKGSSGYIYGNNFEHEIRRMGRFSRIVINAAEPALEADRWQVGPSLDEAVPVAMPEIAKLNYAPHRWHDGSIWEPGRVFGGIYREISPKLDDDTIRRLAAHFMDFCRPSDAATIYDYRKLPRRTLAAW